MKMNNVQKALIRTSIFAAAVAILTGVGYIFENNDKFITNNWLLLLIYFFLVSFVSQLIFYYKNPEDVRAFIKIFQRVSMIKFLLHLVVIVIYVLTFRNDAKPFAITFMAYYLLFTIYELIFSQKKMKEEI